MRKLIFPLILLLPFKTFADPTGISEGLLLTEIASNTWGQLTELAKITKTFESYYDTWDKKEAQYNKVMGRVYRAKYLTNSLYELTQMNIKSLDDLVYNARLARSLYDDGSEFKNELKESLRREVQNKKDERVENSKDTKAMVNFQISSSLSGRANNTSSSGNTAVNTAYLLEKESESYKVLLRISSAQEKLLQIALADENRKREEKRSLLNYTHLPAPKGKKKIIK